MAYDSLGADRAAYSDRRRYFPRRRARACAAPSHPSDGRPRTATISPHSHTPRPHTSLARRPAAHSVAAARPAARRGPRAAALVRAYLPAGGAPTAAAADTTAAFKRLQNGSDIRGVALQGALCDAVRPAPRAPLRASLQQQQQLQPARAALGPASAAARLGLVMSQRSPQLIKGPGVLQQQVS